MDLVLRAHTLLQHPRFGPRLWALANCYNKQKRKSEIIELAGLEHSEFVSLGAKCLRISTLWQIVELMVESPRLFEQEGVIAPDAEPNDGWVPPWEK